MKAKRPVKRLGQLSREGVMMAWTSLGAVGMSQVDGLEKYTVEGELAGLADAFGCVYNGKRRSKDYF